MKFFLWFNNHDGEKLTGEIEKMPIFKRRREWKGRNWICITNLTHLSLSDNATEDKNSNSESVAGTYMGRKLGKVAKKEGSFSKYPKNPFYSFWLA